MKTPFLSVIIPCYNEEKRLPLTLIDIDGWIEKQKFLVEVIVVNDGSTDNTAKIAKKFQEKFNYLKFIDNSKNQGKGAVVREGMLYAKETGDFLWMPIILLLLIILKKCYL